MTTLHFPNSKLLQKFYYDGDVLHGGLVGNYVIIEGDGCGFIAKVINVELPEKERLFLSESAFQNSDFHPIARVEPQVMFDDFSELEAVKGLGQYPAVGSKVYVCSPQFLGNFLKNFGHNKSDGKTDDLLTLANFVNNPDQNIQISANALLTRHCAIVGTTGSGKSYTVAKIIEEMLTKDTAKVLLLDATGEFEPSAKGHENLTVGKDAYFDYSSLEEEDFFALFRPAGQVQMPKLQEALRSLKVVAHKGSDGPLSGPNSPRITDSKLIKVNAEKADYTRYVASNAVAINKSNFNIMNLPAQIIEECAGEFDAGKWGTLYARDKDNVASLVIRVMSLLTNDLSKKIFNLDKAGPGQSISQRINDFVTDNEKLVRIDVSSLANGSDVAVIFVNAIGRTLYNLAKQRTFVDKPLVVFLDEAHLFLNRVIKDEYSIEQALNSFDKIAKECRKFGLFICISSQRPMDIPSGILSQMGAFVAHRLINSRDIESVVNAAPDGSASTLSFLPSLGKGEAIIVGVDFPMPLNLQIKPMDGDAPSSHTPKLFVQR